MNLRPAVVRSAEAGEAVVELEGQGCGRCHEAGGCGGHQRADLACRTQRLFRVVNGVGAQAGDAVIVSVPEGAIAKSASLAYVLPLLTLFAGTLVGSWLLEPAFGEAAQVAGAMGGLLVGWLGVRRWLRRHAAPARPQIVAKA